MRLVHGRLHETGAVSLGDPLGGLRPVRGGRVEPGAGDAGAAPGTLPAAAGGGAPRLGGADAGDLLGEAKWVLPEG